MSSTVYEKLHLVTSSLETFKRSYLLSGDADRETSWGSQEGDSNLGDTSRDLREKTKL